MLEYGAGDCEFVERRLCRRRGLRDKGLEGVALEAVNAKILGPQYATKAKVDSQ